MPYSSTRYHSNLVGHLLEWHEATYTTVNDQLTAANTWQTFSVNLGSITAASPIGATWQLDFQLNASQWGGPGLTDTLTIDNIILETYW